MDRVVEELLGELKIIQDRELYRFTSDSVILTKFARAKSGDIVADFCSGSGIVGLHFYALNRGKVKKVVLFELQESLAKMSEESVKLNALEDVFSVENVPLQAIGREYDDKFSLILCNPPYEKSGFENDDYHKAICRKEITLTLPEIVEAAFRKLKFSGRFALLHRADRIAELIFTLKKRGLEPKRMQFVSGREGQKPYLVLVEAVKGGKEGVEVLPTLVNT